MTKTVPARNSAEPAASSGVSGVPPMNATASTMVASTMAEPRSPWSSTTSEARASMIMSGRNVARRSPMRSARRARRSAAYTSRTSLSSSEGWKPNGPRSNHALAPLTLTPNPGMATAMFSANTTSRPGTTIARMA